MDEPIIDPAATTEPAAAPDAGAQTVDPTVTDATGTATAVAEPSDLEAYLAEQLKDETPAAGAVDPNAAAAPVVPEEFKAALGISEYVKSAEHIPVAIRAAAEVWDVANGKVPASQMLEGMRAGNPQGFEKVVGDLIPYIEKLTGQKFGAADANAAPDPVAELRAEIAAQKQQQETERQQQAYEQQRQQVIPVYTKAIDDVFDKSFGAGHGPYFAGLVAQILPNDKALDALSKGDTKPLEEAIKQVKTEELKRFKSFSEHLIKQSKDFRKSLPAAKGGSQPSATGAPATSAGWTREQSAEFLRTGIAPE